MRRVLGDPPTWAQMEFHPQQPDLPIRHPDPLVQFVTGQISQLERQVVTEATEYRGRDLGPALVRYAHYVRDLCAGYRRVVAAYVDTLDAASKADAGVPAAELAARRAAVADLAATWRKDRGWRDDWSPNRPGPATAAADTATDAGSS